MKHYFKDRNDLVPYVVAQLSTLENDLPWTMTITQEKLGVFSVLYVTTKSLEDIGYQTAQFYSATQRNT